MIAKSSTLAFSKPFFSQGLINRRAVLKSTYAQFLFLMSGADHDQMDRMRSYITNMCTGWDVEQVKSIVGETLHDIVDPLVFAEAAELIADHKLCGRDVVVVSASGEEIVAPIARALGATHAMATRMVVEDGKYTGEIAFYCYGEGKVEAIRALAAREGYALEHCYAYSDSITDLPMLEAVGHPTVVNPGSGAAQGGRRARLAGADVLQARVAARSLLGPVGCGRRHHGGRRGERAGGRRADLLAAAPLRVLSRSYADAVAECGSRNDPAFTGQFGPCCDRGHGVQRKHGSRVRPRSSRKRRLELPNPATQHGSRHPRGAHAAIIGKSVAGLRNCENRTITTALWVGLAVVANRKNAEATHATHQARLVTGVRASGRRAEDLRIVRSAARFMLLGPSAPALRDVTRDGQAPPGHRRAVPALLSTNHAVNPSGVPDANPRAAAR